MAIEKKNKTPQGVKTPDNKRKSLAKTPVVSKPNTPGGKKGGVQTPAKPAPTTPAKAAAATPIKKDSPKKQPQQGKGGVSAQLAKVSDKSKNIKKDNKRKGKGKGPGGPPQAAGEKQAQKSGRGKRNRHQRLQNKLNAKIRTPQSCARALKAEQELNKNTRVFHVKLADKAINLDVIKTWSSNIENALFPKPVEPRSFLIVLKPNADVKKELEVLRKVNFGGSKITVEEKSEHAVSSGIQGDEASLIDPYTLYVTNLDESVTKDDLKELFPKVKTVMNPRKHNPKISGSGSGTKFAFVNFESAEDALEGLKEVFNKEFKGGKGVVARFRRVGRGEVNKPQTPATATPAAKGSTDVIKKEAKPAAAATPKAVAAKGQQQKKNIKEEPMEESDDEEEEDDDEEDVDMDSGDDDDDGLDDDDDDDDEEEDDDDDDDE